MPEATKPSERAGLRLPTGVAHIQWRGVGRSAQFFPCEFSSSQIPRLGFPSYQKQGLQSTQLGVCVCVCVCQNFLY